MKKALRLTLLLVFAAFCSHAQRRAIDSIIAELKQPEKTEKRTASLYHLAFQMADINPDTAIFVGRQAVLFSQETKNDSNYVHSCNSLGWAYYRGEEYDSAEKYYNETVVTAHKLKLKKEEGRAKINLATLFQTEKSYEKALSYALPVTALFDTIKDEEAKFYTLKLIGIIYREMGQLADAKTYLLSAMNGFKAIGDEENYNNAVPSLGSLYLMQHIFDSALIFYRIALAYRTTHRNINTAFAIENMGDVYFAMADSVNKIRNTDSALYYYMQAKNIFEKIGGISDVAFEEINIGRCLHNLKRYAEAIPFFTHALEVTRKNKETDFAFQAASELSKAYDESGNYRLAFKYLQESNTYKDSIDASNNKEKIAGMFAKYETDKKDRTILLLNTQQKLNQQQISRQNILTILLVTLALFSIFIGLILWNRRGIKHKLEEVEMRNQLSSDLHDDIGSSLSSILLLSTMAAQRKDDTAIHNKLLEKINSNAKEVIDRMSDIVWTMNPKYDEGESLRERLENYIIRLKEITAVTINGNIDKRIDHIHFSMELRKNIFLIIKEAMNNALKHAGATLLQLDLTLSERHFELVIKDNGIGFDQVATQGGNGFETMINRAKASNGECIISSASGKGTEVKAVIPIPHIR